MGNVKVTPEFATLVHRTARRRNTVLGMANAQIVGRTKEYAVTLAMQEMLDTLDRVEGAQALLKTIQDNAQRCRELEHMARRTSNKKRANEYWAEASKLLVEAREASEKLEEMKVNVGA